MENEKNNTGSKIIIVILVLVIVALVAYLLLGDKLGESKTETTKEETLTVKSREVLDLYNKVSSIRTDDSFYSYYKYLPNRDSKLSMEAEFDYLTSPENVKLQIAFDTLQYPSRLRCYDAENKIDIKEEVNGATLACTHQYDNQEIKYYSREVVENAYKDLYGTNEKFNTNTLVGILGGYYKYNKDLDAYLEYTGTSLGGTSGTWITNSLTDVKQVNNDIIISEEIAGRDPDGTITDSAKVEYTFVKDSQDGRYNFRSRKVVK